MPHPPPTRFCFSADRQVGEAPVGYGYADLTQDELTYTISGLSPGVSYTVYVSAFNRHGQGARAVVDSGVVTPPLAVPSAPTNVSVATKGYNATEGDGIGDSQVRCPAPFLFLRHVRPGSFLLVIFPCGFE